MSGNAVLNGDYGNMHIVMGESGAAVSPPTFQGPHSSANAGTCDDPAAPTERGTKPLW